MVYAVASRIKNRRSLCIKNEFTKGEIGLKRYCKNVDITDRNFISTAVRDCIAKKLTRKDTIKLFCEYSGLPYNAVYRIVKHDYTKGYADGLIETVIDERVTAHS